MIQRSIKLSKTNSFFLFGPRGVGKTTLLSQTFLQKDTLTIDLLDLEIKDQILLDPSRFQSMIDDPKHLQKRVVVDEIQKIPSLLDIVHQQIQKKKRQFILTGSSARRLKQQGTNLLAGRAWIYNLYPFSWLELSDNFQLKKALEWGTLPEAYLAADKNSAKEYLSAYVGTYLEKEIQQEQWVRKLEPFRRFLSIAAQMNGKIVNCSAIAREVGVDSVTISNYFEILTDTLLGFYLEPYHRSVRKAQKSSPKFYFIDTGIKRALDKTLSVELLPQTYAWGESFESFFITEVLKLINYNRLDWSMTFLKTKDDLEIDLIIERPGKKKLLIEIKSKDKVSLSDCKSLHLLGEDLDKAAIQLLVSSDKLRQTFKTTTALHWIDALEFIFN